MSARATRIAFFVVGAIAIIVTAAQAGGGRRAWRTSYSAECCPPPAHDTQGMFVVQNIKYQLWFYRPNVKPPHWRKVGIPHDKHGELHSKGKMKGRRHVHHKYWNKTMLTQKRESVVDDQMFTVTIVVDGGDPVEPSEPDTPMLPLFTLYYCNGSWQEHDSGFDFDALYEHGVADGREGRDCSEMCDARRRRTAMYFTICADGETPGSGRRWFAPALNAPAIECYPIECYPERTRHFLAPRGFLRSRRGCFE